MKKILTALVALSLITGPAFAAGKSNGTHAKLVAACKDKQPGDMVQIDGKDMKCPAPKKAK